MNAQIKLGFVGVGRRGLRALLNCYQIRDQNYLSEAEREADYPYAVYNKHAIEVPSWAEDISSLQPQVTAIFDPLAEAREKARELCQQKGDHPALYDTFEAFLMQGEYDAVIVSSPNDRHVEAVIPLLENGVDLLCEKPIATTLEDHDRIIKVAKSTKAVFYAGFNLRSAPIFVRIKQALADGAIGRLGMISCREIRGPLREGYRYIRDQSGGSLLEKVCHDFDLFSWYAETEPVRVSAFGNQHIFRRENDTVDQATVIVEYKDGLLATLELCLYAPFGQRERTYEFRGSDGLLRSLEQESTVDLFTRAQHEHIRVKASRDDDHYGGDFLQTKRFLRCLRGYDEPPGSPGEAKRAASIALAAERAIVEGQVIEIDANYDLR